MRPIRFVAAHEWKVKESVGADVLGGPQPQSNANRVVGRLRAAEDVRPYRWGRSAPVSRSNADGFVGHPNGGVWVMGLCSGLPLTPCEAHPKTAAPHPAIPLDPPLALLNKPLPFAADKLHSSIVNPTFYVRLDGELF